MPRPSASAFFLIRSAVAEAEELRRRRRRVGRGLDHEGAQGPQVGEDARAERGLVEVVHAAAAARADAAADDALDHARVALAEDEQGLLELDQAADELARPGQQR